MVLSRTRRARLTARGCDTAGGSRRTRTPRGAAVRRWPRSRRRRLASSHPDDPSRVAHATRGWVFAFIASADARRHRLRVDAGRAARRTERAGARARGGIEPPGDVYELMRIVYPGAFPAMLAGAPSARSGCGRARGGAIVLPQAKPSNGGRSSCWVPSDLPDRRAGCVPGARGPYRWMRHRNYVGVLGELPVRRPLPGAGRRRGRDGILRRAADQANRR